MKDKYLAKPWYDYSIEKVVIDRETDASVWIKGRKNAKCSEYGRYFDTWEDAHAFILNSLTKKLGNAEEAVNDFKKKLEVARRMTNG